MHTGKLELIQNLTGRPSHPFEGKVMDITFLLGPRVGDNFEFFSRGLNINYTSSVKRIEYEGEIMRIHTHNSIYQLSIDKVGVK